jgi:hypothetical protein
MMERQIVKHSVDAHDLAKIVHARYNPLNVASYLYTSFFNGVFGYFSLYQKVEDLDAVPAINKDRHIFEAAKQFCVASESYRKDPNKQNASDCLLLIKTIIALKRGGVKVDEDFGGKSAKDYLIESGYVECKLGVSFKVKGETISEWRDAIKLDNHFSSNSQQTGLYDWISGFIWNHTETNAPEVLDIIGN